MSSLFSEFWTRISNFRFISNANLNKKSKWPYFFPLLKGKLTTLYFSIDYIRYHFQRHFVKLTLIRSFYFFNSSNFFTSKIHQYLVCLKRALKGNSANNIDWKGFSVNFISLEICILLCHFETVGHLIICSMDECCSYRTYSCKVSGKLFKEDSFNPKRSSQYFSVFYWTFSPNFFPLVFCLII